MAFPAAFAILLAKTLSSIGYPQGMPFWAVAMQPPLRRVTILMKTDCPKFSSMRWCTQPRTTTTIAHQTGPQARPVQISTTSASVHCPACCPANCHASFHQCQGGLSLSDKRLRDRSQCLDCGIYHEQRDCR
jgi:hypothetical protein